jgi:hypothetical protein
MEQLSFEITAELNKLTRGLDRASAKIESFAKRNEKRLKQFGQNAQRIGQSMSLAVTLPILAIGGASVKAASDFEETESKFQTIFKNIRTEADKTAKSLSESYGLSNKESLELLGNTGDLLTGFGFTQKAALDLSRDVNQLAVDLASFTNFSGGAKGASQALTKALLGERESVKSLGISILEADVKAKVLENTQKGLTFESNRQAKAFATLQIAQEQSKNAIGDYARTSGSFANQTRLLQARISDLAVEFGKILLPYAQKLLSIVQKIVKWFTSLDDTTKKIIVIVGALVAAIGPLLLVIGGIASALPAISIGLAALTGPVGLVIAAVAGLTAIIIANWDTIKRWANDIANYFIELYNDSLLFRLGVNQLIFTFKTMFNVAKFVFNALVTIVKTNFKILEDIFTGAGAVLKDLLTFNFGNIENSLKQFANSLASNVGQGLNQIASDAKKLWVQVGEDLQSSVNAALSKEKIKPVDLTISDDSKKDLKDDVAESVQKGVQEGLQGRAKTQPIGNLQSQGAIVQTQAPTAENSIPNIITDADAQLGVKLANMQARLQEFSQSANDIIQNGIANAFIGLGQVIGDGLSGGTNTLQKVGQVLIGSFANIITQLGQLAIKTGTQMLAIKLAFNGFGALGMIAAGTALVALGSAFSKQSQAIGSNLGSGGGGTGSSVGGGGVNNNFSQSFSANREIILRVRGRDLVAVLNNQNNFNNALG